MPLPIQRVPRGLGEILSIFGGQTPQRLSDEVGGVLELVQYYGLQQNRVAFVNNAAAAEGANVDLVMSTNAWTVLFAAEGVMIKTATMTAGRISVRLQRNATSDIQLFGDSIEPFGATETGPCSVGGFLPYPLLCPPNTIVRMRPQIIGTDATANVTISAEFGTLG